MNDPSTFHRIGRRSLAAALAMLLGLTLLPPGHAAADAQTSGADQTRTTVGKGVTPPGTLLQRAGSGKEWHALKPGDPVHSGDHYIGLPGAAIESQSGAVRLDLLADLSQQSPYPVREAVVVPHPPKDVDLDFTLDRGRVDLINLKKEGAAKVRVRFRDQTWELTLTEPKTRVALELYGRWQRGVPFNPKADAKTGPAAELVLLVLHGQANLHAGAQQFAMAAPPGPASYHWDTIDGQDPGPKRLVDLPHWADPQAPVTPEVKAIQAAIERFRQKLASEPVDKVLTEMLHSDNPVDRRGAVTCMGAVDDLQGLFEAFSQSKDAALREHAIQILRHWIGRGPGQDMKLYQALIDKEKYTPGQAATVLQLLHSFGDTEQARPETYEILISYLKHPKLGVRELARWQLYRLVPAGKDIAYDPAGSEADRERASEAWKKLIPSGKLPPQPKPEKP
jgi:hypothetical protein